MKLIAAFSERDRLHIEEYSFSQSSLEQVPLIDPQSHKLLKIVTSAKDMLLYIL